MKIFIYPFNIAGNEYISSQKRVMSLEGNVVYSLLHIYKHIFNWRRNIAILNWFEDRVIMTTRPVLLEFLFCVFFVFFVKVFSKKTYFVMHNFKPHNNSSLFRNRLRYYLVQLLRFLATETVTHRPLSSCKYVPHPLYDTSQKNDVRLRYDPNAYPFLFFGVISTYKNLESLLRSWPVNTGLVLLGRCLDIQLKEALVSIIRKRQLKVYWEDAFIDSDYLDYAIKQAQAVVLPHADNRMVVSGAFYHAVSVGCSVIALKSEFTDWLSTTFSFVSVFEINEQNICLPEVMPFNSEEVYKLLSDRQIYDAWSKLINS